MMERESTEGEATELEVSEKFEFPCDNCGASMTWDPKADSLACDYCGHRVEVPHEDGLIVERALEDAGEAIRGYGVEVRVAKCQGCGARVTYDGATTSEVCVYCGSPTVLAQEANRNAIRPESLVPLDVDRSLVQKNFEEWIQGLWFRPNELKKTKRFDAAGIYVPFWTFDCHAHSDWAADAGYYYYVTETYTVNVNGKTETRTRQVRKTRWRPAWGSRDDRYDDILINASFGVPEKLVRKLGDYDTKKLVAYRPEFLAGWRAEEYQVDLEQGWGSAHEIVVDTQRSRCSGDVPGDTQRNLRVKNLITDVRWKHILLPLWSVQYRFGKKTYTVLVNGQTGRVVGDAPYSWIKILLFILSIVTIVGLIVVVAKAR